ncbi:MAG: hypothetical protein FJ123_04375 [Deltaproteobacteria bacterium]|nr:hypothetical protein [Deltaproteobacteria bacterium]
MVDRNMVMIKHLFNGILDHEVNNPVDDHGLLTVNGEQLLKKMGVIAEQGVIIDKSTIRILASAYNEWKIPINKQNLLFKLPVTEWDDPENRVITSRPFIKLGIKIGEGTKIGKDVYLGLGASIGKYCRISDLAEICMGSTLHDRVYVGREAIVCKGSEVQSDSHLLDGAIVAPYNLVKRNIIILPGCVFTQNNKSSPHFLK